jgi:hypothetical protein
MNNLSKKTLQLTVVAGCLLAGAVFCDASVYLEPWTNGVSGWQIKSIAQGAGAGTIANTMDRLDINVTPPGEQNSLIDIVFTDTAAAEGTLIETHTVDQSISFTFYSNMDPTYLYAYVKGSNAGGTYWWNELSSVSAGAKTIGLDYDSGDGWNDMFGSAGESDWLDSLTSFDEVGIALWYPGTAGQEYQIDNFTIDVVSNIPEPETWLMLGFALLSITITFRRQINETMVKVRSDT